VVAHLVADVHRKTRVRLDDGDHKRALRKLAAAAESAKVALSSLTQTALLLEALADDRDYTVSLSRAKLDDLATPVLQRVVQLAVKAATRAGLAPAGVECVVMSGGGCAMPRLQALVGAAFPGAQLLAKDPEHAVAKGCAQYGALLQELGAGPGAATERRPSEAPAGPRGPAPLVSHKPVLPRTLLAAAASGDKVPVLRAGTPLPAAVAVSVGPGGGGDKCLELWEEAGPGAAGAAEAEHVRVACARVRDQSGPGEVAVRVGLDGCLEVSWVGAEGAGDVLLSVPARTLGAIGGMD